MELVADLGYESRAPPIAKMKETSPSIKGLERKCPSDRTRHHHGDTLLFSHEGAWRDTGSTTGNIEGVRQLCLK